MKTGLVVTAHPGDFVWRAGGAIALHAKKGYRMKIVCMSFGERGESQFACVPRRSRAPGPGSRSERALEPPALPKRRVQTRGRKATAGGHAARHPTSTP